jgi:hypothetical protein
MRLLVSPQTLTTFHIAVVEQLGAQSTQAVYVKRIVEQVGVAVFRSVSVSAGAAGDDIDNYNDEGDDEETAVKAEK